LRAFRSAHAAWRGGLPTRSTSACRQLVGCRKFIALHSTLALAQARFVLVQVHLQAHNAGRASVAAKHAENELAQCAYVAEGNSEWTAVFKRLQGDATALWSYCERVRFNVYSQSLSSEGPGALPEGRSVTAPIAYEPPTVDFMLEWERV
jgi:hypothetical protein